MQGCVLHDSLVCRRMPKQKERARILLISDSLGRPEEDMNADIIATDNVAYQCADLKTRIEQEELYMAALKKAIVKLRPDVIVVQMNISLSTIELLSEQKIAAIRNVDERSMERLARLTQATITTSAQMLMFDTVLGECDFWVQDQPNLD